MRRGFRRVVSFRSSGIASNRHPARNRPRPRHTSYVCLPTLSGVGRTGCVRPVVAASVLRPFAQRAATQLKIPGPAKRAVRKNVGREGACGGPVAAVQRVRVRFRVSRKPMSPLRKPGVISSAIPVEIVCVSRVASSPPSISSASPLLMKPSNSTIDGAS